MGGMCFGGREGEGHVQGCWFENSLSPTVSERPPGGGPPHQLTELHNRLKGRGAGWVSQAAKPFCWHRRGWITQHTEALIGFCI